jgi:formylglycine-generating enzyme
VCIDQFEFPNIACEYPLVWARANEAMALCKAVGKRLCDAHEWEGACAGTLRSVDREYAFGERRIMMQYLHNKGREVVWAYGKEKNHALCATAAKKSPKCFAGGWHLCGTNDWPSGSFPECVSALGVYDQHGNVAEHMNFPMKPEELGSRGGFGQTEMKGSWFIFAQAEAHEDDCRFRAPDWHASSIDDPNSHRNYHLGFRCCRDL